MKILERLGQYLLVLGVPGLFLIALLDSAAIPMVGGPDAVILLLSWRHPSQLPAIVLAAAIGSLLGCLILYRIGRTAGRLVLERFSKEKQTRVMRLIERNATWAVFLSVTMPPPFPTKPMILAAGVFRTPLTAFGGAVFAGRLIRFSLLAWLGARFGDQAAQMIKAHYFTIIVAVIGIALVVLLFRRLRRKQNSTATPVSAD